MRSGGWPLADDSPAPPLPQRVPGSNRHAPGYSRGLGAKPVGPAALPEHVVRHIRSALDSMRDEASVQDRTASAERPAALPRRVPGASNGPRPPAITARPGLPSTPRSRPGEASTDQFPAISPSPPSAGREEITVQLEPATAVPADPQPTPAPLPRTEELPHRQRRPDEAAGLPSTPRSRPDEASTDQFPAISPSHPSAGREEITVQLEPATALPAATQQSQWTSQTKSPARRAAKPARRAGKPASRMKGPTRSSKPPPSPIPSPSPQPVSQMALVFPLEPPGEEGTEIRPALIVPQRGRLGRLGRAAATSVGRLWRLPSFPGHWFWCLPATRTWRLQLTA